MRDVIALRSWLGSRRARNCYLPEEGPLRRNWKGVGVIVEMNEYTSVNSQSRTYDANGNLTDDGTLTYAYDALNRLVEVTDKSSSVTLAEYSYDHKGRRITRNVDSDLDSTWDEEVRYYYLGGQVVEEQDSSAATQWQYVWGGGLLQASSYSGGLTYVHENGYGSVMATTPESAEGTFDDYDYDGFGGVVRSGGAFDTKLAYRFRGMRFDAETSFYSISNGAYYNPALGSYLSRVLASPAVSAYSGAGCFLWQQGLGTCRMDFPNVGRYYLSVAGSAWRPIQAPDLLDIPTELVAASLIEAGSRYLKVRATRAMVCRMLARRGLRCASPCSCQAKATPIGRPRVTLERHALVPFWWRVVVQRPYVIHAACE